MRTILGMPRLAFRSGLAGVVILATMASFFVGTANATRSYSPAPLAAIRGFALMRSAHNPDGTIAATWRSKSGQRIYYLGKPGARLSLVRHTSSRTHGHKKITLTTYSVAVHMASSSIPVTTYRRRQSTAEQMAALRSSTSADAARGRFPESVAKAFVKDLGNETAASAADIVGSTCISFFDQVNVEASGCDTRTALQKAAGNSYLADSMLATITVASFLAVDLTRINDWIDYSSTSTNDVVSMNPLNPVSTNCNSYGTWSVTWHGIGFSSHVELCGGTMTTWGLTDAKGGGGWSGKLYDGQVVLQPVIEDHNTYTPAHTDPTSTYDITTQTSAVTLVGQCPFGTSKCG
jgi:hypothetical protein